MQDMHSLTRKVHGPRLMPHRTLADLFDFVRSCCRWLTPEVLALGLVQQALQTRDGGAAAD